MKMIEYTIQKGDNLSKIAQEYHTTVNELVTINNIKDPNNIYVGQKILVPADMEKPYPGTPSLGETADAKKIWDFFVEKLEGNEYGAAGVLGNLEAESNLRSNNLQNSYEAADSINMSDEEYTAAVDNGTYTNFINDRAGYGLAQWTHWARKEWLYNYAQEQRKSIQDFDMQLEFLWKELSRDFKKVVTNLKNATSVREASNTMLLDFEQPGNQTEENQIARANRSQRYYDKFATQSEEIIPEVPVVENILDKGTIVLLIPEAKNYKDEKICVLFQLFKLQIKSVDIIDEKIVYTLGIFKDFSFFDFQTTEENFIVVKF